MADRTPLEVLADEIKAAQKTAGLTDAELARRSFIARETLRRKLAAAQDFTIGELANLADALEGDLTAWVHMYREAKAN